MDGSRRFHRGGGDRGRMHGQLGVVELPAHKGGGRRVQSVEHGFGTGLGLVQTEVDDIGAGGAVVGRVGFPVGGHELVQYVRQLLVPLLVRGGAQLASVGGEVRPGPDDGWQQCEVVGPERDVLAHFGDEKVPQRQRAVALRRSSQVESPVGRHPRPDPGRLTIGQRLGVVGCQEFRGDPLGFLSVGLVIDQLDVEPVITIVGVGELIVGQQVEPCP